jgi:myo-inositol-1(or 4)-monophosphatase
MSTTTIDRTELLDLAVDLGTRASRLLLDGFGSRTAEIETKTSTTDMVTEIDRASEVLIVQGLRRARPDDGIVGEEGSRHQGSTGIRWVIDPLDGTTNYLYGLPAFAVSIAAEQDGEGIVGVVVDPPRAEVFAAAAGCGATCNGRAIRVSGATELSTSLVATGFGYQADQRARQAQVLTRVLPRVRDIRRYGAAALDMCWVACGRIDAYYESGIKHWDVAAGAVIAREAGAYVEGVDQLADRHDDPEATPPRVIATTPAVANPLRDLLEGG